MRLHAQIISDSDKIRRSLYPQKRTLIERVAVRFVPIADIAALIGGQQKCNVEEQKLARLSSRGDYGPTMAAMFENFALVAERLSDC